MSFIKDWCISSFTPKSLNKLAALLSASYPPISPNSPSNSPALKPSSSVKSSFAYKASFSCITSHIRLCPCITVFKTVCSSNSNWFCFKNDIRSPGVISTEPLLGSISPLNIFKKVDLPAPLAPIIP